MKKNQNPKPAILLAPTFSALGCLICSQTSGISGYTFLGPLTLLGILILIKTVIS
jgi:hypothetical protein